jgi:3D-(3,5/4)-trihydroxycyclohexane-1,2-dione acylhydrolase (decyclizing)
VYASRRPDPVLQQVEDFGDGTLSANDCFRPVSRYFDRITRPEQIMPALMRALQVLTDPAECGPVTLALCQDTQAEAYDYPLAFFAKRVWGQRRPRPCPDEIAAAAAVIKRAKKPLIVAGGGVAYCDGGVDGLLAFAGSAGIPIATTQAGKSAVWDHHPIVLGAIGVTGTAAANSCAAEADVILAVGTRLQDFTTGSRTLFANPDRRIIALNIQPFDAGKHAALPVVADAIEGLIALAEQLPEYAAPKAWTALARARKAEWTEIVVKYTAADGRPLPSDAQVIGAVQRATQANDVVVSAAGGLPGELHKLWQTRASGSYHVEYGYSCMGYEIAGGLGVKMADPTRQVVVMVGDGSYLMMNSEIATSVMMGLPLIIVVLDNRGFGCINRLQQATGSAPHNNLFADSMHTEMPTIDFAAHAASLGAQASKVSTLAGLEAAVRSARNATRTTVVVIDTDPTASTCAGGHWWDVAVPEVSDRGAVTAARAAYDQARQKQRLGD